MTRELTNHRLNVVLEAIRNERIAQDEKSGERNLPLPTWLAVLREEVDTVAQACIEHRFGGGDPKPVRAKLIQVAAVAAAMIECGDRNGWWKP